MKICLIALIVTAALFSAVTPASIQAQPSEREKKKGPENRDPDRKGLQKFTRDKMPMSGERGDNRPAPFLMAGDPRFEQMLKLALVDMDEFNSAIKEWPQLQQMSEMDKRRFIRRVTLFRQKLREQAMEEAQQLGLNIPEDRKVEYFQNYWTARMRLEKDIRSEAKARHEIEMKALREKLQQEW